MPHPMLAESTASDAEFLATLGRRVRGIRKRRGMTRKLLARAADVSERYLGQLELGDGNISVMLLRRVAAALDVTVADLLMAEEHGSIRRFLEKIPAHRLGEVMSRLMGEFGRDEAQRRKRVALVGLRGAGKSTLGGMLASSLRAPLIELNREIEHEAGLPVAEIFALYGQPGYRRFERRALERVLAGTERAVLSVGGGIVGEEEAFDLLLNACFTVWLRASPEEHMSRVLGQGDLRPMAGNERAMDDLKRILATRESLYGKADAIIDTSGQTPRQSLARLRQALAA